VVVAVALLQRTLLCTSCCGTIRPMPSFFNQRQPGGAGLSAAVARHWIPPGWMAGGWMCPMKVPDDSGGVPAVVRAERPDAWIRRRALARRPPLAAERAVRRHDELPCLGDPRLGPAPGKVPAHCGLPALPEPPTSPWIRPACRARFEGRCWFGTARRSTAASSTCLEAMTPPGPCMWLGGRPGRPCPGPAAPGPAAGCARSIYGTEMVALAVALKPGLCRRAMPWGTPFFPVACAPCGRWLGRLSALPP